MQLILETEPDINITSTNMSTLEDVIDKKIMMNGIIENVLDINMGNKENINKSVNLIDEDDDSEKINDLKCSEEETLSIENEEYNKLAMETHIINNSKQCIENELSMDSTDVNIKLENKDDTASRRIENDQKEHTEVNKGVHNISDKENVCVDLDENNKDNEKDICLNDHDNNSEEQLISIKKEINSILQREVLNLDQLGTSVQSNEEINIETNNGITDNGEIYIEKHVIKDYAVKKEAEDFNNVVKTQNNQDKLLITVSVKTVIDTKVDEYINSKLTQLIQPIAEEVSPNQENILNEKINTKNINVVETLTDVDIQNDNMVHNISTTNENTKIMMTDIETVGDRDHIDNTDNKNAKLESMDVEFIQEDNNSNNSFIEKMDVENEIHMKSSENVIQNLDESSSSNNAIDCDEVTEIVDKETSENAMSLKPNTEVMVLDEDKDIRITQVKIHKKATEISVEKDSEKSPLRKPPICRLSNTLDILSDDDEDEQTESGCEIVSSKESEIESNKILETENKAINLEDDDDIVVIEEDVGKKKESDCRTEDCLISDNNLSQKTTLETDTETGEMKSNFMESIELSSVKNAQESASYPPDKATKDKDKNEVNEHISETTGSKKPLIADGVLSSTKKRLADMTREELEEFCVLKIVESIVDRSNLSEIKLKLKTMAQSFEEYSKKAMVLYKQNRDLQVVLKSIQEEQKKTPNAITPLKITRSVGMQVLMIEKSVRKKGPVSTPPVNNNKTRNSLSQSPRPQKSPNNNIPVPRLIPANNAVTTKGSTPQNSLNGTGKQVPVPNGVRSGVPAQKLPEKRPLNKSQSTDCVDLTDDEPPAKIIPRSPATPVRLVPPQNLLAPQRAQFGQTVNSPRKVYIPISSPQSPNIRPGQTFMVKAAGPRPRGPASILPRMPQNQMRLSRTLQGQPNRHPAPLPDAMKQYQPPNWKALPPAPDLKLSKVENGIVISWKIEGYQEDSYEDIASYQLYAYQETSSPPSTALWKKIGDVKALPLPMACTLTQFMSGFKYYFAVRAVDVRSRLGPFSLPGSILLLNKI